MRCARGGESAARVCRVSLALAFPRIGWPANDAATLRAHSTRAARRWWMQLYRDAPVHVFVETVIIIAILYILIVKESYDPAKR